MTYKPEPIDVSKIKLPKNLEDLVENLAENAHDYWAAKRIEEGWEYGAFRNDATKKTEDSTPTRGTHS